MDGLLVSGGVKAGVQAVGLVLSASIWGPLVDQLPDGLILVAFGGLGGGISRWLADRVHIWPSGLSTIFTGVMVAMFMWPLGQPLAETVTGKLELEPVTAMLFGAYVTGLLGVSLIAGILDLFTARKRRLERADD